MAKIRVLDEITINRIAAGEVVERPASAVKELVENSLDAGAKRITIEIQKGGKSSLRIVDDGEGMTKDDALLALERHATSKIRSGDPLNAILTMGFRGEALPAIAGVSKLTLTTRAKGEKAGTRIEIAGGTIKDVAPHGGPEGTTIDVRDLYFNTPARRKFLKGDGAETAAVAEVVANAMLAAPEVAFKLVTGNETHLVSTGSGGKVAVAQQLFSVKADQLIEVPVTELTDLPYKIEAVISRPQVALASRRAIRFFVNGRPIKSAGLSRAVTQAYRNAMPVGGSPLALVFIDAPPAWVDVNVHPAKLEVRFQEGHRLEEAIAFRLGKALAGRAKPRELLEMMPEAEPAKGKKNAPGFVEDVTPVTSRGEQAADGSHAAGPHGRNEGVAGGPSAARSALRARADQRPGGPKPRVSEGASLFAAPEKKQAPAPLAIEPDPARAVGGGDDCAPLYSAAALPGAMVAEPASADWGAMEVVGQMFDTYILGAIGGTMYIVDQHAAHERVLYERALERLKWKDVPAQRLLFPVTLELPRDSVKRIEERLPLIQKYGFEAEIYSGGTLVVSSIPTLSERMRPEILLRQLVGELDQMRPNFSADDTFRVIAATIACRSAVMAGEAMDVPSMGTLVGDLAQARQPMTCAHGRPSVLTVSAHDLDRRFLRCT